MLYLITVDRLLIYGNDFSHGDDCAKLTAYKMEESSSIIFHCHVC